MKKKGTRELDRTMHGKKTAIFLVHARVESGKGEKKKIKKILIRK